ncbi:hypothetical protein FB639_000730 [Coemansia asiatica]|nr:hypothetical protein FB639_000730 [Coemansia asiatica]
MILSLVRGIYLVLAGLALAFELAPWTREAFVKYGKTRSEDPADKGNRRAPQFLSAKDLLSWFSQQTVPKNWFWHFYFVGAAVGIVLALDLFGQALGQTKPLFDLCSEMMSTANAWLPLAFEKRAAGIIGAGSDMIKGSYKSALLALSMYNAHVMLRLKETMYDQPITCARMHIGQYGVGIIFYIATPFAVVADSCFVPGWTSPPVWAVIAGVALYIYASVRQWRCHHILYRLRNQAVQQNSGYVVPDGDLFSLVACPHFLCEILIYLAIWIATGFQATSLIWTIFWTVINLGITARETQRWYRQKFGSKYPRCRKALVPYIW